ncbi:signal peptidase I [Planococcus sp. YIM B11945]|uniref:signal peptidase I n=1 Tax=Planococcus sp. YIM B11945 TaxID=3435410 RepID=UPI003D7C4634
MYEEPAKTLVAWMKVVFLTVLIALAARQFLFEPVAVHGKSMMPTIEENDKIVISKISRIDNFDLIVFVAPDHKNLIKRVIGIPGDRIEMKEDHLYINGQLKEEPYLKQNRIEAVQKGYSRLTEDMVEFTIPSGCYYVMGDNRLNSIDSRMLGFIQEEDIVGEVKFRIGPAEHAGMIE